MKILIWEGYHGIIDGAIKLFSHGQASHAAFLRADGKTVHEAFWPRVRDRLLTDAERPHVHVFDLAGTFDYEHRIFESVFDYNIEHPIKYSVPDLFRFAFNMSNADESHTFCSRYVLHCCAIILPFNRRPLVRIPDGDWGSPRDLFISPRLIPTILP